MFSVRHSHFKCSRIQKPVSALLSCTESNLHIGDSTSSYFTVKNNFPHLLCLHDKIGKTEDLYNIPSASTFATTLCDSDAAFLTKGFPLLSRIHTALLSLKEDALLSWARTCTR